MKTPEVKIVLPSIDFGSWEVKKAKLKEKFPLLTDSDLKYEEGKMEEMIDKIHTKIGNTIDKTKEGLHKIIEAI